jgi:hypothetical protein
VRDRPLRESDQSLLQLQFTATRGVDGGDAHKGAVVVEVDERDWPVFTVVSIA